LDIELHRWKTFDHLLDHLIVPPPDFESTFIDKVSSLSRLNGEVFATNVIAIFVDDICQQPAFKGELLVYDNCKVVAKSSLDKRLTLSGVI